MSTDRIKQPFYGWYINGMNNGAVQTAMDILPKFRPTITVFMNNLEGADRLYNATGGQTTIIHRFWQASNSEDRWDIWKPQDWINFFSKMINDFKGRVDLGRFYHAFLNEPKVGQTKEAVDAYTDFVLTVLRWARDHGIKLAFPIPNAEVPWEVLMEKGYYDRLLKAYDDEGFRGVHIGFIHEYTLFHTTIDMATSRVRPGYPSGFPPDVILDPNAFKDENWPTYDEVNNTNWQSNWTMFRGIWVAKRLEALGRQPIPTAVTEASFDSMPHLEAWYDPRIGKVRNIKQECATRYGVKPDPYMTFQGAITLRPLYEKMFPEVVRERPQDWFEFLLMKQFKHLAKVAPPHYLGFAWFMLDNGSFDWDRRSGFSYHDMPHIYKMFIDWADELKLGDTAVNNPPIVIGGGSVTTNPANPTVPVSPVVTSPTTSTTTVEDDLNKVYSIRDYMQGDGRLYQVKNTWAGTIETMQTQTADGKFYYVKNSLWEELWMGADGIYRGTDTSPGGNELYQLSENGVYGSLWIKSNMRVGESVKRSPTVTFKYKDSGANVQGKAPYQHVSWIKLEKVYKSYVMPSGVVVNDVIELACYNDRGGVIGDWVETYWYAKNYGLVSWQGSAGRSFIIKTIDSGIPSLSRELINWFKSPAVSYPGLNDLGWSKYFVTSSGVKTNIRSSYNTKAPAVGYIEKDESLFLINGLKIAIDESGYKWLPIIALNSNGTPNMSIRGWVRDDVIKMKIFVEPVVSIELPIIDHTPTGPNVIHQDLPCDTPTENTTTPATNDAIDTNKLTQYKYLSGVSIIFENISVSESNWLDKKFKNGEIKIVIGG